MTVNTLSRGFLLPEPPPAEPIIRRDAEIVNAIKAVDAAVDTTVLAIATAIDAEVGTTGGLTGRNRIINGDMRIDQRNAGAAVTATAGGVRAVDRWHSFEDTDGTATVQQLTTGTPPTGFTHYHRFTVTAADTSLSAAQFALVQQRIEGVHLADLGFGAAGAQSVTVSFWVRSSVTGTFSIAFANSDVTRSYPATYVINVADTWERKTVTVAGDTTGTWLTTTGVGLNVRWGLGAGSTFSGTAGAWAAANYFAATGATNLMATNGATFDLTGVQLEPGTVATAFERRLFADELALCKRYYQFIAYKIMWMPYTITASNHFDSVFYPTMRIAPTVTLADLGSAGFNTFTADSVYPNHFRFYAMCAAATGGTGSYAQYSAVLDAEL